MQFKYHKGYKGYYLQENNKYVRPYRKLDKEKTEINLGYKISKEEIILETKYVVLTGDQATKLKEKTEIISKEDKLEKLNLIKSELSKIISPFLLERFLLYVKNNEGSSFNEEPILEIIDNVLYSDITFKRKAQKTLFFSNKELENIANRYYPIKKVDSTLKENIVNNYPEQYIYEHLPLDYKELEMVYVLYFITIIELMTLLK